MAALCAAEKRQPFCPLRRLPRHSWTQAVIPEVHSICPFCAALPAPASISQPFQQCFISCMPTKRPGGWPKPKTFDIPNICCGNCAAKAREYTNATSTGLVAQTKEYDPEILKALGLAGADVPCRRLRYGAGPVEGGHCRRGGRQTKVVLCATHDTASAVEGIPMERWGCAVPPSGTWSLLGVKLAKPITSPESRRATLPTRAAGYIRYLKTSWVCASSSVCKTAGHLLCRDGGTGQDQHLYPHF